MDKIKVVSRIARILLMIIFYLAPLITIWGWVSNGPLLGVFDLHLLPDNFPVLAPLPKAVKSYGFLLSLIPTICGMIIVFSLARLFLLYEHGYIFEKRNAHCIKVVASVILLWELIRPFYDLAMNMVFRDFGLINVPWFNFDISNVRGIIIGVLMYVIAWVMQEAHTIKQEHDYTI